MFDISPEMFNYVIMPLLIFLARIIDVSIGTIRIIFVSRGKKYLAPILGFCETVIWLIAMGQIMQNVSNIVCYIAYGAGFAAGTLVGMIIEEKLALGILVLRIILTEKDDSVKENLIKNGFGITVVDAHGANGKVKLIYTVIKRKSLDKVTQIIESCHANAFYSVEDARVATRGVFPVIPTSPKVKHNKKHHKKH